MTIEAQLAALIEEAPEYGFPPEIMQQGVTPILRELTSNLDHLDYFICQNAQLNWLITTLRHRSQPESEKKVIYAFSTLADAIQMQGLYNESVSPVSIPVTHLLFQLFALKPVDSIIFMDTPGNLDKGKEIAKSTLFQLLQGQLQQLKSNNIPPDIA